MLCLIVIMCGCSDDGVSVSKVDYKGWTGIELQNRDVKVVVVPEIGRIMHYSLIGEDNVLYVDSAWAGKKLPSKGPFLKDNEPTWATFGGDRIWPTQESDFMPVNGSFRPPDYYIDGGSWEYELLQNGVKIESKVSEFCGAKVIRWITLNSAGTNVEIKQSMVKVKEAKKQELEPIGLTLWNLSKIRLPEQTFYPISTNSVFEGGTEIVEWPGAINHAHANYFVEDHIGVLVPDENKSSQKVIADARGWIAGIVDETLFSEKFSFEEGSVYPDNGSSIAIYMSHFAELECLSPLEKLEPGETLEYTINWGLRKLESSTASERRKEAVSWLSNEE